MTTPQDVISAVVITYNPDEGFAARFDRVRNQVGSVIIVDNASQGSGSEHIEALSVHPNVSILRNEQNRGVATALNQGIEVAAEQGRKWVLLLDQDTLPAPHMVGGLLRVYQEFDSAGAVGIVGSNYRDLNTGREGVRRQGQSHIPWTEQATVITSGSLLSIDVYDQVGPFRDDFFIDQVDHEYCLRLRARGYRVLMSRVPLMEHSIGKGRLVRLLGQPLVALNEPPLRLYYSTRNRLTLFQTYLLREPRWVVVDIARMYKELLLILLVEENKRNKLKAILLGVRHFLQRRSGPLCTGLLD